MKSGDCSKGVLEKIYKDRRSHDMVESYSIFKGRNIKKILCVLFGILMLSDLALAYSKPRVIQEQGRRVVIFKNQPCKPMSSEKLRSMMGPAFDESKMALDEDSVKRSRVHRTLMNSLNGEDSQLDKPSNSDEEDDDSLSDESADDISDADDVNPMNEKPQFMRRRRDIYSSSESASKLDTLFKKLVLNLPNRKQMKRIKRKIRKSSRYKSKITPQWICKFERDPVPMEEGYFPPYVMSGKCSSKKCFLNLYECIPKLYPVKILKRDPDRCNPVPSYGVNTTYEETWFFDKFYATVYCECGRRAEKKRRRHRKNKSSNG